MSDRPLNFNEDEFRAFDDAAPDPDDALAAFDSASGITCVPPGTYTGQITSGELVTTRKGKRAYKLTFAVTDPDKYAGFTISKWFTFNTKDAADFAKDALKPLELKTSADLKSLFPNGRVILCKLIVGLQRDDPSRNDLIRFSVISDTPASKPANPFSVDEGTEEGASK